MGLVGKPDPPSRTHRGLAALCGRDIEIRQTGTLGGYPLSMALRRWSHAQLGSPVDSRIYGQGKESNEKGGISNKRDNRILSI